MKTPFSRSNKLLLIIIILASTIAVACASSDSTSISYVAAFYPPGCTMVAEHVCRVDDPDKGVSCYLYFQGAVSCVKLK